MNTAAKAPPLFIIGPYFAHSRAKHASNKKGEKITMKNMKLGPRLILSFGIVVLLASLSGIMSTVLLMNVDSQYSEALVNNGFSQGDIGAFNTDLNKGAALVRDIVLLTDPADIAQAQADLEAVTTDTSNALAALKETCQSPDELKYIAIIDQKLPEYRNLRDKVIALGLRNQNDEALQLFREQANPVLTELMDAAQGLVDLNIEMGYEVSDNLSSNSRMFLIIAVVMILVAAGISIAFAFTVASSIAKPVVQVRDAAKKLEQGDLDIHIAASTGGEVGDMINSFNAAADMLQSYIQDLSRGLNEISNANFNIAPNVKYKGSFVEMERAIVKIISSLSDTMANIGQCSDQVAEGSNQVSAGAQTLSQGATEQASSVEELAATITEISAQIQQTSENAGEANSKMEETDQLMVECDNQMKNMVEAINEISDNSQKISHIIKTIEDIAFQTNILALNAAVEAARAGTAGKGFAVVADEVRNLAGKSAEASKNTSLLIEAAVTSVDKGVKIATSTATTLNTVAENSKQTAKMVDKIAAAAQQQSVSIAQVTTGIDQISSVVQNNSATAEESAAASEELSGQAQLLKDLISQFTLLDSGTLKADLPAAEVSAATSAPARETVSVSDSKY